MAVEQLSFIPLENAVINDMCRNICSVWEAIWNDNVMQWMAPNIIPAARPVR